jgi:hypothetical protein
MLRLALVGSLIATSGEASAGLDTTLARARELVSLLGDSPQLFPVRFGLWRLAMARADLGSAETGAAELLASPGRAGDAGLSMAANVAAGATSFYCGQFERARAHFEAGLTFHDPEVTAAQVLTYGQDLEAVSLGYLGWVEAIEGRLDRAVAYADRGLESARRAGHPFSVAFALMLCGMVWQLRREPAATARFGEELLALARSQGFVYFVAVGLGLSGLAAAASGDAGGGFARMREGASSIKRSTTASASATGRTSPRRWRCRERRRRRSTSSTAPSRKAGTEATSRTSPSCCAFGERRTRSPVALRRPGPISSRRTPPRRGRERTCSPCAPPWRWSAGLRPSIRLPQPAPGSRPRTPCSPKATISTISWRPDDFSTRSGAAPCDREPLTEERTMPEIHNWNSSAFSHPAEVVRPTEHGRADRARAGRRSRGRMVPSSGPSAICTR